MKSSMDKFKSFIEHNHPEFINFRYCDLLGQWREITMHISQVDENTFQNGIMFDGSSLLAWKEINDSDMVLMPDDATVCIDPFAEHPTCVVICDVFDPKSKTPYNRDPRSISKKVTQYIQKQKLADELRFGPEPEFFIFDEVSYSASPQESSCSISSVESEHQSKNQNIHNSGHYAENKTSYCSLSPKDLHQGMRSEMLLTLQNQGVLIEKHHHEVAHSQHELGIRYQEITTAADVVMHYKHTVKNVAHRYNKTATFMPKPLVDDNGSGMHVHQSLLSEGVNLFQGTGYAGLSETALYYIGGILKHIKAINAFTNPTINSYKRLTPGYEAPTFAVYSAKNRSAGVRIPHVTDPKASRMEARFPDASGNIYLCFAAMALAGIDGIKNKIHPGASTDIDLFSLSEKDANAIPRLSDTLEESINALEADHEFLMVDHIFDRDFIQAYIQLKRAEIQLFRNQITPLDFKKYYSC